MTISRLSPEQTRDVLKALATEFLRPEYNSPEPPNEAAVVASYLGIAASPAGRVFGLFDEGRPRGLIAGVIIPHPETGVLTGIESHWWSASGGLQLLDRFEDECREAGCKRVICAYSEFVNPERTRRIYERHGYRQFSVSMAKEL